MPAACSAACTSSRLAFSVLTRRSSPARLVDRLDERPELVAEFGLQPLGQPFRAGCGAGARAGCCGRRPPPAPATALPAAAAPRAGRPRCPARRASPGAAPSRPCPTAPGAGTAGAGAARRRSSRPACAARASRCCGVRRKKSDTTLSAGCSKRSTWCSSSVASSSRALGCMRRLSAARHPIIVRSPHAGAPRSIRRATATRRATAARRRRRCAADRRRTSAPPAGTARARAPARAPTSVSSLSSGSTGTTACATIGPWSRSAVTKCTVAPLTLQPASIARRCVCRPVNAGSSDGWMLSSRPA